MTQVRRQLTGVAQTARDMQNYLHFRGQELKAKAQKEKARKTGKLDDLVMSRGVLQDDGSVRLYLDTPVPTEKGKEIIALEKHRSVTEYLDEEAVLALATELGILDEIAPLTRVVDHDTVYFMNQKRRNGEKIISDEQFEALMAQTETFSLTVVEE